MDILTLAHPEPVSPGVVLYRDVMVAMRDGVRLATDIYMPDGADHAASLPVVLERTPYGKGERSRSEIELGMDQPMTRAEVAARLVKRGYVAIYQDCRGRYASEGVFTKYLAEGPDGFDTLAWIVEQPWCDGKIGTMGFSYAAHRPRSPVSTRRASHAWCWIPAASPTRSPVAFAKAEPSR